MLGVPRAKMGVWYGMKYAVTGHTGGIGLEIQKQTGAIGFSRSNGFNICKKVDRTQILDLCIDVNVFVNNACDGFGQSEMLLDFFCKYRDSNKTIINVGSDVTEKTLNESWQHLLDYQMYKKSLKILTQDLQAIETSLQIKYVSFGYVGTERILEKYPQINTYITVTEAVRKILS